MHIHVSSRFKSWKLFNLAIILLKTQILNQIRVVRGKGANFEQLHWKLPLKMPFFIIFNIRFKQCISILLIPVKIILKKYPYNVHKTVFILVFCGGVKGLTGNNVIYHPRYPQKMQVYSSQFTLVSRCKDPDLSLF